MMDAAREPYPSCPAPMDPADLGYYQPELHALHDVAIRHNWTYREFCRERDLLLASARSTAARALADAANRADLARREVDLARR